MILISACFLGVKCRYNGEAKADPEMMAFLKEKGYQLVPVCPEQLGGLSTPRPPAEIIGAVVMNSEGMDVTEAFARGAEETLNIAKLTGCNMAVLKESSPSCGSTKIYDGTFGNIKIPGKGLTAALLTDNGIKVFSEENYKNMNEI